jgi:L,D-peptidoglycan transpeptidase YkuD (ErfK/YbiS/YcfS/YnhG family)
MDIVVSAPDRIAWNETTVRCAVGRGGITADKHEGDGATPAGRFPLRRVLFRADRAAPPQTALPVAAIAPDDGWCDDPDDPAYNRPVKRPYPGRHEALWRDDEAYDLIVVVGHNDDPVVPGAGSAIFIHVALPGYPPTEGCVALARDDLQALVAACGADSALVVTSPP